MSYNELQNKRRVEVSNLFYWSHYKCAEVYKVLAEKEQTFILACDGVGIKFGRKL